MLQIFIIMLFQISPKKLSLYFYYSQNVIIILKIIQTFYELFDF